MMASPIFKATQRLQQAVKSGDTETAASALDQGADVGTVWRQQWREPRGMSALAWAVTARHDAMVELLLLHGARVDQQHLSGHSALQVAARQVTSQKDLDRFCRLIAAQPSLLTRWKRRIEKDLPTPPSMAAQCLGKTTHLASPGTLGA